MRHRLDRFNISYESEPDGINIVLSSFFNTNCTPHYGKLSNNIECKAKAINSFNNEDFIIKQAEIDDLIYLQKRGISENTLQIFLPYIKTIKSKNSKYNFLNIGFPYTEYDKNTLKGMEVVNYNWKRHAKGSDKTNSAWFAKTGNGVVTNIFFSESAIDAMSYYQLYSHRINKESSIFISTGGVMSESQVKEILYKNPYARINTAFDKDLTGNIYDIRLALIKEKKTVAIIKKKMTVEFQFKNEKYELPFEAVTLTNFRKVTKFRTSVNVQKPSFGKDFNEMLQRKSH